MIFVTVDNGYDVHTISISETTFTQIQTGHPVVVAGQGFPVEGVMEQDEWAFNYGAVGAVHVPARSSSRSARHRFKVARIGFGSSLLRGNSSR